jgi:hypothetical protein
LAGAQLVVDFDQGVDFFAAPAVGFEADAGFQEFDLGGDFGRGSRLRFFVTSCILSGAFSAGFCDESCAGSSFAAATLNRQIAAATAIGEEKKRVAFKMASQAV